MAFDGQYRYTQAFSQLIMLFQLFILANPCHAKVMQGKKGGGKGKSKPDSQAEHTGYDTVVSFPYNGICSSHGLLPTLRNPRSSVGGFLVSAAKKSEGVCKRNREASTTD